MIKITGEQCGPYSHNYKVRVDIRSQKEQETCELYAFIRFMLGHDPEMLNAVLNELMHEITESTYNMDPERFAAYKTLVEGMG